MGRRDYELGEAGGQQGSKRSEFLGNASTEKSVAVGLEILMRISPANSKVVVKSASSLSLIRPTFQTHQTKISSSDSCFLKSCFLCNKSLSPDKDIYMYRGDQGFCSVECRNRQIYLDERRELEAYTKRILASFRHPRAGANCRGRCDTRVFFDGFEKQRRKSFLSCRN